MIRLQPEEHKSLAAYVYSLCAVTLDESKGYLLESRLARLVEEADCGSYGALLARAKSDSTRALERRIVDAITTNETFFFRDTSPFDLLRHKIVPELIDRGKRTGKDRIRIWSAACSTGQEAYSLAMLLLENFPSLSAWNIRIEGTDISSEVVERAQEGRYHRIEMNRGLPARHVVRYFDHIGEDWIAKPQLRQICNFRLANLCESPLPFRENFDVIFLRNVMLYFSHQTRVTLMANMHRLLAPDGVLFLGSAEQPANPALWSSVLAGGTCHLRPCQPGPIVGGESIPTARAAQYNLPQSVGKIPFPK